MQRQPPILQYLQVIVDFYMLLLSSPMRRFPRLQSERIFIGSVCLLSLNIVSLFQSSLATVLIKPMYYKNIDTLQQFADTRQKILIQFPAMLTDIFPEDSSDTYRVLHGRMFLDSTETELTALNVVEMGLATVTRKTTLKLMKEETLVHMIPECPKSYNLAFVLTANSVFLDRINSIILDINRYGFMSKWIQDSIYKVELESSKIHPPTSNRARILTIDDMQLPFLVLMFGIFVSFLTFLTEKLINIKPRSKVSFIL